MKLRIALDSTAIEETGEDLNDDDDLDDDDDEDDDLALDLAGH